MAAERPRVASLLPSATEIVCALDAQGQLVARTAECTHPPQARDAPVVVDTKLPTGLDSGGIDDAVREAQASGQGLYQVDGTLLADLEPDLVVTQTLCDVCAASQPQLDPVLNELPTRPEVVTLDARSLEGILEDIARLGTLLDREEEAHGLLAELRERLGRVRAAVERAEPRRVAGLEWLDPPMACGHWMPDLVEAAGGHDVLGRPGEHGRRVPWSAVEEAEPGALLLMPCGFDAQRTAKEAVPLLDRPEAQATPAAREGEVLALDGDAHFSRPGPRVVEGVEVLAHVLHPDRFPDHHPEAWTRVPAP